METMAGVEPAGYGILSSLPGPTHRHVRAAWPQLVASFKTSFASIPTSNKPITQHCKNAAARWCRWNGLPQIALRTTRRIEFVSTLHCDGEA